ncbi:hypothetical protein [Spirochaeta lutea]|uniref:Uncharacterized protein n=1 Tax=Spirochaeta lutea TaxID=1480694 RepID=A0A098QXJ9_9SPIO|nr:hypothetical protein [Spirochaeta lutea]KGE71202.1 hypothetical protein DC28_12120 [Spirochaeta lutea]
MKRVFSGVVLFFMVVSQILAIDPVRFEVLIRIPNGSGSGQLQYSSFEGMGPNPSTPRGFLELNGVFYVADYWAGRLMHFTIPGPVWGTLEEGVSVGEQLLTNGKMLLMLETGGNFRLYGLDNYDVLSLGNFRTGYFTTDYSTYYRSMIFAGDLILSQFPDSGGRPQYHSFYTGKNFAGRFEYRNPDQTIRFLKEDYDGTEEFTVDEDGYIFWNGRLVAPYGDSFSLYHWNTRSPAEIWQKRADQGSFIGWDADDNSYWNYSNSIVVLTSGGELVSEMLAENVAETARSQFTVTPEGTLYVLSYNRDRDEFELMKLDRFW